MKWALCIELISLEYYQCIKNLGFYKNIPLFLFDKYEPKFELLIKKTIIVLNPHFI